MNVTQGTERSFLKILLGLLHLFQYNRRKDKTRKAVVLHFVKRSLYFCLVPNWPINFWIQTNSYFVRYEYCLAKTVGAGDTIDIYIDLIHTQKSLSFRCHGISGHHVVLIEDSGEYFFYNLLSKR